MDYVIGIDFGSDSVRALLVNAADGQEMASAVHQYSRWKKGLYCDPNKSQFRQHPQDYTEGLEQTIKACVQQVGHTIAERVRGISVDTTGSTIVAVNRQGRPLALTNDFSSNPNAMFVLWKDHTATLEADEINQLCSQWPTDYSKYVGGIYSSEWFWAKILKISRDDVAVRQSAYSWVEHCDWISFLLTGGDDVTQLKASRCAAGHKAMWHESWAGLPPNDFFVALDPLLDGLVDRMYQHTYTSDKPAGTLSQEWADRLGLSSDVVVGVGAFDAHMGAVGGEIKPNYLCKIMGTSTCDIVVIPNSEEERLVKGICGQVKGSVVPGMLGLEAGQSAFGDVYAWYAGLIREPMINAIRQSDVISVESKEKLIAEITEKLLMKLVRASSKEEIGSGGVVSLEWMNGRRTPDANQRLRGAITGLNLGSSSAKVFRSLLEATCYGARKIVERFVDEGIEIRGIIALGGVAQKSPEIMQMMADVMNRSISVVRSQQTCALGAAIFAAVCAEIHPSIEEAMQKMGQGFQREYHPIASAVHAYEAHYQQYCALYANMDNFQQQMITDEHE